MTKSPSLVAAHVLLCTLLAAVAASGQAGDFELVRLAEGVYAATRTEPPGLTVNGNSVFIIDDDEFRRALAGDSRVRRNIFDSYVLGAGLAAAFADAPAKP